MDTESGHGMAVVNDERFPWHARVWVARDNALRFLLDDDRDPDGSLMLSMSPEAARQLGRALIAHADAAEGKVTP